jgi:hypothetical protein
MKKTFLLLTVALAAGVVFQGCVYMDYPNTQMATEEALCTGVCANEPGSGLANYMMGTAGPASFFFPKEPGEYWGQIQNGESFAPPCVFLGGGGGATLIHTMRNEAYWDANGCPPSFICSASGFPANYTGCLPNLPDPTGTDICGAGNSTCLGDPFNFGGPYIIHPPGTYLTEDAYVCVDEAPGSPYGAGDNLKRRPGNPCPDCATAYGGAAPTPGDDHKTLICHVPRGNPDNAHTINIDVAAVPAHLGHGDPEDSLGVGCGAGPVGGGLGVPMGDAQPDWTLGVLFGFDNTAWKLLGVPWTDDYQFGSSSLLQEEAAQTLLNVLANNPMDDQGFASIAISKLSAHGETVTLSPPYTSDVKMGFQDGVIQLVTRSEAYQDSLSQMIRFILDHTQDGQPVDWNGFSIELSSGDVISGSTLNRAAGMRVAFGHNRLAQALEHLGTLSEPTTQRLDRVQTYRR